MSETKISFITFTRNSAEMLDGLLRNVGDVVDEIIVVDGYSTDETVEVARSHGAVVYQRKPWGYADPDRMFALRMASHEWILYLDTDERLGRRLKSELRDLVARAPREVAAFSITRANIYKGRLILGPSYPDAQIRLYRKGRVTYKGLVHEQPSVHGLIYTLPEEYYIIHYGEQDFWPRKWTYYAKLEALEYYEHKTHSRIKRMLWKLTPFSIPLIGLSYVALSVMREKPLNAATFPATLRLALYEGLVHTLMKFRSEKQKKMAKLIQEKGLIELLKL